MVRVRFIANICGERLESKSGLVLYRELAPEVGARGWVLRAGHHLRDPPLESAPDLLVRKAAEGAEHRAERHDFAVLHVLHDTTKHF